MTQHVLEVTSKGPWSRPPKTYLAARCSCKRWTREYSIDELRAILNEPWARVREALEVEHENFHAAMRRELAESRPEAAFYG